MVTRSTASTGRHRRNDVKATALALLLLAACCTHGAEPSAAKPAVLAIPAPSATAVPSASVRPLPAVRDPRSIPLPQRFVDEETGNAPAMSLVAGELPTEAHPAGTAIVSEVIDDGQDLNELLYEWDLASGELVRKVRLDVPFFAANVRLFRSSSAVHVLASAYNGVAFYLQLTSTLEM